MVAASIDLSAIETLDFGKGNGFIPAVVQHAESGTVLMVGYMNREALRATFTRRRVVFFSRTKRRLWEKGETSGHFLELEGVRTDCDRDTLLVRARPRGPVCHLGTETCFGEAVAATEGHSLAFLRTLENVVADRMAKAPAGSYTAALFLAGKARIAQKLGEEGLEVALAAVGGTDEQVVGEAADLLYHLLVLLKARGLKLEQVSKVLEGRHGTMSNEVAGPS